MTCITQKGKRMSTRTYWIPLLSLTALVGLGASEASAGTCQTEIRNVPAGADNVAMTCRLNTGTLVDGANGTDVFNGQRRMTASLNAPGQGSATQFVRVEGMNAAGVVLSGCSIEDRSGNRIGQSIIGGACAPAVKWRGTLGFSG